MSKAPTIDFTPVRIKWSPNEIAEFSKKVSPILDHLVANYTISPSNTMFDVFLTSINKVLIEYATATNKSITLPPP